MRDSYCAEQVRRLDPDRYVTALFAPHDVRGDLLALYAFNTEVARIREAVSDPILGQIRLQWWRDALAECHVGAPREHFVVTPLAEAIRRHGLSRPLFERLIDAREADLGDRPPETIGELIRYARDSSGSLVRLALEVLGARDEASQLAGDRLGTAWALTGLLRALPYRLRFGRSVMPIDLMRRHRLRGDLADGVKQSPELNKVVEEIASTALDLLEQSRAASGSVPRSAVPAMLLATLAELYLKRLARTGFDPLDPRNAAPLRFRVWSLIPQAMLGRY